MLLTKATNPEVAVQIIWYMRNLHPNSGLNLVLSCKCL